MYNKWDEQENNKIMFKKLAAAGIALLLMTACSKSVLGLETTEKVATLHAENAPEEDSASGSMTVGENECVIISPNLSKGEVNIVFKDHTGNIELNEAVKGKVLNSYEITPGEYDVSATMLEKTTGEITILVMDKDEFDKEQFDLQQALEAAGVPAD